MSPPSKPTFGKAIRDRWLLDPEIAYLNHGTVGVAPIAVLDAQDSIRRAIETNPSAQLLRKISGLIGSGGGIGASGGIGTLREAAARVAHFLGTRPEDLVFVGNATEGVNAVLRSFKLTPGDAVLTTEHTYGGVRQAVRYTCREAGAEVVVARLPCPIDEQSALRAVEDAITNTTRLAVLDHIISETGVVLPVAELVELCHSRGVLVLIDGAHAPAQVPLDIPAIGADYYAANLHKWAFAPRSTGVLWVGESRQTGIHPPVISWKLDESFTAEFDWTGTRDLSTWLAAPAGIDFLNDLGVDAMRKHNHELVWAAVEYLTQRWQGISAGGREMTAFMASVQLPAGFQANEATANRLRDTLLFDYKIEVPIFPWRDRLWARLSAQVYNEFEDFERLAEAIEAELPD